MNEDKRKGINEMGALPGNSVTEALDLVEEETQSGKQSSNEKMVKSVLVVDDDPLIARILRGPLERAGYDVRVATHGLEALQHVRNRQPDLIILDVLMPLLDGFKTARILKFDKRFRNIPIIVLTSRATEGERRIGEQVGANEYLYKPFRPPQVLDTVKRYLNA